MKVERVIAEILELPYRTPLVTAKNRFSIGTGLLVTVVTADGVEGYGYSDVFPRTGETAEGARLVVERVLAPLAVGRNLEELGAIREDLDRTLPGNPRARSALDSALADALARSNGVPLHVLLGGRLRDRVGVIRMVGLGDPDRMAEEARRIVAGGGALKLKLGGEADLDVRRVARVRAAVGDAVFLKVDANEAYGPKDAIRVAGRLADHGVAVFEQPVPRGHLEALGEVTRRSPIPIEADQSVRTVADAALVTRHRLADAVNTGIARIGGLDAARRVAELCAQAGLGCTLSNTAGSQVGDATAVHLAAATPGIAELAELGEFEALTGDPFTGLRVEGGSIAVPAGIGIGVIRAGGTAGSA